MIKVVIIQIFAALGLGIILHNTDSNAIVYWSDLGIIEQIRIIAGLVFMVSIAAAACVIFRSVWVKNGYAGIDQVLVDKEVALFMSHVLAFMLLETFFFMILFYKYTEAPQYAFWICGAGFLSPEVVQVMHFIMDRVKSVKRDKE